MSKKYLSCALVYTMNGAPLKDATVVIEDGKIVEVGRDIAVPADGERMDFPGCVLTPGLIDAHTHIGTHCESFPESMSDTNDMVDPIAPQLRTLDAFYPDDTAFQEALAGGVTCTQTLPGSGNVIGGQGVIIKTRPDVVERMVLRAPSGLKGALGENPVRIYSAKNKLPNTRMGSAFLMRNAFVQALNHRGKASAARMKEEHYDRDLGAEVLLSVLDGDLPFHIHCHRSDDIQTAVRICEEFDLNFTIEHCTEGHLIADWLAKKKVRAAVGPTLTNKSKLELRNKTWETPYRLWKAGVHFCIITDHPVIPLQHLNICAALAARAGLPEEEALAAITIYAAEHIGVADRLGSIAPGKDADLVVWDGEPLDARTQAICTLIEGKTVYEASK